MLIRLNRFIASSGIASRRKSEEYILQGRVSVNDKIITDLSYKVDDEKDIVLLDDEKISPKKHLYFLLNKPKGIVTTTDDDKNRKTVVDLIKTKERIFPIGRLDYDTTGVLLLTNDGEFSNLLTHPKNEVPREYEVKLDKPLAEQDRIKLLKGINLDGSNAVFIKVFVKDDKRNLNVICAEGRNRFVKRMFGALGYTVLKLNRKKFAGLTADIPLGSYRKLTTAEVKGIINQYGK
jgi:23S rRNA pseudouridine2605 synthase